MRWMIVPAVVTVFAAAGASSPEPSQRVITLLATSCTAGGPFLYRFGEHSTGESESVLQPFAIESFVSDRHEGLFAITAAASFAKAPMSGEDRIALARWVLNRLDSEIVATRRFVRRQTRPGGVAFSTANILFELTQTGTTVRLTCTDTGRKKRARNIIRKPGSFR